MSNSNQKNNQPDDLKTSNSGVFGAVLLILCIVGIWLSYPFILNWLTTQWPDIKIDKTGETFGTFGDTYGALNTLFSGLAFAILILSLFLQRKELQAQRKELEAQRNEIKESNDIARQQREITKQQADLNAQQIHDAKVQSFYTLLFKFLDEKRIRTENTNILLTGSSHGNNLFDQFVSNTEHYMKCAYLDSHLMRKEEDPEQLLEILKDCINDGHEITQKILLHEEYFEYISFILDFIEQNEHLGIQKNAIKIFMSFQSYNEMYCMFLASFEDKYEELKRYIIKYSLLIRLNSYHEEDDYLFTIVEQSIDSQAYNP